MSETEEILDDMGDREGETKLNNLPEELCIEFVDEYEEMSDDERTGDKSRNNLLCEEATELEPHQSNQMIHTDDGLLTEEKNDLCLQANSNNIAEVRSDKFKKSARCSVSDYESNVWACQGETIDSSIMENPHLSVQTKLNNTSSRACPICKNCNRSYTSSYHKHISTCGVNTTHTNDESVTRGISESSQRLSMKARHKTAVSNKHVTAKHSKGVNKNCRIYTCMKCKKIFLYLQNYDSHVITCQGENSPGNSVKESSSLQLKVERYGCMHCTQCFTTLEDLKVHINFHEQLQRVSQEALSKIITATDLFECKECGQRYSQKEDLQFHERTHTQSFDSPFDNKIGIGEGSYQTTAIKKVFKRTEKKKKSDRSLKNKAKQQNKQSRYPSKKLHCQAILKGHMEKSKGNRNRRHTCSQCKVSFSRAYTLTCHVRKKHSRHNNTVYNGGVQKQCSSSKRKNNRHRNRKVSINSKNHSQSGISEKFLHACTDCNKSYTRSYRLKCHIAKFHSPEKGSFMNNMQTVDFQTHTAENSGYNCEVCGKNFTRNLTLKRHMQCHKDGQENKPVISAGQDNLGKHYSDRELRDLFNCSKCEVKISRIPNQERYDITKEMFGDQTDKQINDPQTRCECQICPKSFSRADTLKLHIRKDHPTVLESDIMKVTPPQNSNASKMTMSSKILVKCEVCGKNCTGPGGRSVHFFEMHTNIRYNCNKCPRSFPRPCRLRDHFVKSHPDAEIPNLLCPQCGIGKPAFGPDNLHRHILFAHLGPEPNIDKHLLKKPKAIHLIKYVLPPLSAAEAESWKCDQCGQQFLTKVRLQHHIAAHIGFKPYDCHLCSKKFSRSDVLKDHINSHKGIQPYCCDECGRRFTAGDLFRRHRFWYRKRNKCCKCGEKFTKRADLETHKKMHLDCSNVLTNDTEIEIDKSSDNLSTNTSIYNCLQCDEHFSQIEDLQHHQKNHNQIAEGELDAIRFDAELTATSIEENVNIKLYRCLECGEKFTNREDLQNHKNIHANETPCKLIKEGSHVKGNNSVSNETPCSPQIKESSHVKDNSSVSNETPCILSPPIKESPHVKGNISVSNETPCSPSPQFKESSHVKGNNSVANETPCSPSPPIKESSHVKGNISVSNETPCSPSPQMKESSHAKDNNSVANEKTNYTSEIHKVIKCATCKASFTGRSAFNNHIQTHITASNPHLCTECGKCYKEKIYLLRHNNTHTGMKPFRCDKCGMQFHRPDLLKYHNNIKHLGLKPRPRPSPALSKCSVCNRRVRYIKAHMDRHARDNPDHRMKTHKEAPPDRPVRHDCVKCGKGFRWAGRLAQHMAVHTDVRKHVCKTCGKSYKSQYNLKAHMDKHNNSIKHICEKCGNIFACATTLQRHIKIHSGIKAHTCSTCGKSFVFVAQLNTHMRIHSDVKLPCSQCDKSFHFKENLHRHQMTHSDKRFSCSLCHKSFHFEASLRRHKETHSDIKPFPCSKCDKLFRSEKHLRIHVKEHSLAKPYHCSHCASRFTFQSKLTRHLRVHAKVKP